MFRAERPKRLLRNTGNNMKSIFAKPENVLELAGIALADLALLVSAQQYVPTLHLSKTSFWSGTKINQIRFGSYPDTGLIELARTEAAAVQGRTTYGLFPASPLIRRIRKSSFFSWMGERHRQRIMFVSYRSFVCPKMALVYVAT